MFPWKSRGVVFVIREYSKSISPLVLYSSMNSMLNQYPSCPAFERCRLDPLQELRVPLRCSS